MAAAAEKKIWKLGSKTPTQTEIDVANAFLELEADKDVMAGLSELKFSSAKVCSLISSPSHRKIAAMDGMDGWLDVNNCCFFKPTSVLSWCCSIHTGG